MKKQILLLLFTAISFAQNPTKNASGFYAGSGTMNSSAIGQFDSTAKGFLFPRMTTTQRNAIVSPATSLVIYNTTTFAYNYWNGTAWTTFGGGATPTLQQVLDNNHDLVDGNNFQGTGAGVGNTATDVNAFGAESSVDNIGNNVNAFGRETAIENTGTHVNAFGVMSASQNTGWAVNAFGPNAAMQNTGQSINALGGNACYQNTGAAVNAIGDSAAQGNTANFVNAFGQDSANANTGSQLNAFGTEAGIQNTGSNVNALGNNAAGLNTGSNVNALGDSAAQQNTAQDVNAFGSTAAYQNSAERVNALGPQAAQNNSGESLNALGAQAGLNNQGNEVNAFGVQAGYGNTANNVNAFGAVAGFSNTFKNVNLFGFEATADAENQTVFSKWISGVTKYLARLSFNNITEDRKWELPDNSGTLALLNSPTFTGTPNAPTQNANDNTTKIATTAYADAKVQNSLTSSTTVAPSATAVNTALAGKQDSLGYKPYRFIDTANAITVTGTTAETTLLTITIPPNSFAANDVINIPFLTIFKIGTAGNCGIRLRVSSTNTMSTATQIGLYSASSTQINPTISRHYSLNGGFLKGLNPTTSVINDIVANGTSQVTAAFDTTITQYLFITVTNGNILDSTSLIGVNITN
jgi:hypothetical protein